MTVKELIEELKKCNQDAPITLWHPGFDDEVEDCFLIPIQNKLESAKKWPHGRVHLSVWEDR